MELRASGTVEYLTAVICAGFFEAMHGEVKQVGTTDCGFLAERLELRFVSSQTRLETFVIDPRAV